MFVLLERAKAGDDGAVEKLLEMTRGIAEVVASRMLSKDIEPEDAAQEAVIKVFSEMGKCRAENVGQFRVWVKMQVRTVVFNSARDARRLKRGGGKKIVRECDGGMPMDLSQGGCDNDPARVASARETLDMLYLAAKSVNDRALAIVDMTSRGYTVGQIAKKSEMSVDAVSGVLSRFRSANKDLQVF